MGKIQTKPMQLLIVLLATLGLLAACGQENEPRETSKAAPVTQQTDRSDHDHAKPLVSGLPDFTALVEKEGDAVVNISTVTHPTKGSGDKQAQMQQLPDFLRHFFDEFGGPGGPGGPDGMEPQGDVESLGSGFIISSDGYVLTNYHVVGKADEIVVRLQDRRELDAKVIGTDEQTDLALIKVNAKDLPVVDLGSSEALKVGEWVLAIGAPFGFDSSVTAGIVSAKGRSLPTDNYVPFIQTDVAINPGNSGGPLFNLRGEVVGINSQIVSRSGGYMGLSFAIPIDLAMNVVNQLKESGSVSRGWLGVLIQEVDRDLAESFGLERPMGALVAQVQEDSPGAKAGLQPGDVITEFDGHRIMRSADLPKLVGSMKAGSEAKMTVIRDGDKETLDVTLGELPNHPEQAMNGGKGSAQPDASHNVLGLAVRNASRTELSRLETDSGVVVTQVSDGPAALAGIRKGDLLVSMNGKAVKDAKDFKKLVKDLPKEGTVAMLINRDGNARFLALKLSQ